MSDNLILVSKQKLLSIKNLIENISLGDKDFYRNMAMANQLQQANAELNKLLTTTKIDKEGTLC